MKHFSIWQWTDFVRGVASDDDRPAMDAHLSGGCPRCERVVTLLRGVANSARSDAAYEPPDHAIRHARALYSLHRPEANTFPRLVAKLIRDTFRDPLPAGLRAQGQLSRRSLYEAGGYSLDLQVDHRPNSARMMLVGQLAGRGEHAASTANLPVWLMERESLVASTLSNRFGEFHLEYAPARNLRLHVPLPEAKKRLEVPLGALGGTQKSARGRAKPRPSGGVRGRKTKQEA
jgi:anti-sigma factor RsiW